MRWRIFWETRWSSIWISCKLDVISDPYKRKLNSHNNFYYMYPIPNISQIRPVLSEMQYADAQRYTTCLLRCFYGDEDSVFWVVKPCGDVVVYQGFGRPCWIHLYRPKYGGSMVLRNFWYLTTSPHGVTSQKIMIWTCPLCVNFMYCVKIKHINSSSNEPIQRTVCNISVLNWTSWIA